MLTEANRRLSPTEDHPSAGGHRPAPLVEWACVARVLATLGAGTAAALLLAGAVAAGGRGQTVAGTGLLRIGHLLSRASGRSRAALLIVSRAQASAAAREPGRSLVYFAGSVVCRPWSCGVPYAQAKKNGWLLADSAGKALVSRSHPSNAVADVGNPAYQRAWLRNVSRFLNAHHDDGVFIDAVLADLVPLTGEESASYPTQRDWARAQLSFIRAVGLALRARGYYVLANASGYVPGEHASETGASTAAWWRALAPYVSGLMNEYYQEIPTGTDELRSSGDAWTQNWTGWQRLIRVAQSHGRDFVGVTYGAPRDTRTMSYGKASFLLDWNGRGGAFVYEPTNDANPWSGVWTQTIGRPLARKRPVGVGWLRGYSRGVVLLNASPSHAQRFSLPGRYNRPDGSVVTVETLPPTTGLILRSAAP